MPSENEVEKKPVVSETGKSSMEILSELFSTFDAEPPVIVKKEKKEKSDESSKKHKKSKKKHKKEKKHKKKIKKKKRSSGGSSTSSSDEAELDLAQILIKKEKDNADKIKIEGTNLSLNLNDMKDERSYSPEPKEDSKVEKKKGESKNKIIIKDLKNSSVLDHLKDSKGSSKKREDGEIEDSDDGKRRSRKKHKHKDRDKGKKRSRSRERSKSKSKRRKTSDHKHSEHEDYGKERKSSRRKSKDRGSSRHKSKDRESSRHKSKDRESSRHKSKDRDSSRHKSKDRESSRHKSKDRESSRHKSKDRESSRHKSKDRESSRHKSKDRESSRHKSKERERDFNKRHRSKDKYKDSSKEKSSKHRSRSREKYKDSYSKEIEEHKKSRHKENSFYKHSRDKSRDRGRSDDKWFMRDRYRGYDDDRRYRSRRSSSRENSSGIDKKKLLEIARRNAINMMKSGNLPGALTLGPQAQEKVIAAIKSGGKTIEELTDFCKTLSKKEELGELSSLSEKDDSETDEPFHHPFQLKEKPTSITMNIKNSVPLPTKTTVERTTELRMQFPVSSGQQHRKTENEWVPVSPSSAKKAETSMKHSTTEPKTDVILAIDAPPTPSPPPVPVAHVPPVAPVPAVTPAIQGPQIIPTSAVTEPAVDISSIVSQRLSAMRKLQENPHDVQALSQMYKSNKEMQSWAESSKQLGQFTGSTGAQVLTPAQLSSGFQAWAKKDQLQTAAPVSGGMGMHLLQKMGWKPGEGLGKEKSGALEPLLLEVKLDKKGLVATEEQPQKNKNKKLKNVQPTVKTLQGKHPVSLLGEYSSKRKLGAPQYILEFECGPDHKKNFLFKVVLNGMEYKPNVASNNKKEAKANAATVALQQIGLLPS